MCNDTELLELLKSKYNVPLDGVDSIQMCHMQLVINTVRQHDDAKNTRIIESAINAVKAQHDQAIKEACKWQPVESAPKDGTKFIGLFHDGGVFKAWRQAYNNYKPKEDGGYYVDSQRHDWTYDADDSILPGKLIGWMPLPKTGD